MAYPKIQPCPKCGGVVTVYRYDSGTRRAECDTPGCNYTGMCEDNRKAAIVEHNKRSRGEATRVKAKHPVRA